MGVVLKGEETDRLCPKLKHGTEDKHLLGDVGRSLCSLKIILGERFGCFLFCWYEKGKPHFGVHSPAKGEVHPHSPQSVAVGQRARTCVCSPRDVVLRWSRVSRTGGRKAGCILQGFCHLEACTRTRDFCGTTSARQRWV